MARLARSAAQLAAVLGLAALLSSCLLPEQLDADIVMTGYRYSVLLEGQLADTRTIGTLAKGEALPPNHEERMKAQEPSGMRLPGMIRFSYVGEGRYDFAMKLESELGEADRIVGFPNTNGGNSNFLTIERKPDGTVVISTPEIPPQALADLSEVGLMASGRIGIKVDGKVLESNASAQPADGPHVWNRTSWQDRVFLKFDPTIVGGSKTGVP